MEMIKQVFSFKGKARRSEYWAVQFGAIIPIFAFFIMLDMAEMGNDLVVLPALAIGIATFWAIIATLVRRIRDIGISMWILLVYLIPFVGHAATIAFGVVPSEDQRKQK